MPLFRRYNAQILHVKSFQYTHITDEQVRSFAMTHIFLNSLLHVYFWTGNCADGRRRI
jgi:hypothetical protein